MIIIYLNEMRNISTFIYNFNYIKDLSRIIMTEKCNSVYCEAETDRYQMSKNSYNLLLPNDIFNSKTYIIFTFIVAIMIYMYFYFSLFNYGEADSESDANYYVLNLLMLALLLGIIIYRYVPNDEAGYLNYFGKINDPYSYYATFKLYILVLLIAITRVIYLIKRKQADDGLLIATVKYLCFMFAIILLFNLMNIVMTFRNNTTPILKTKNLLWSLKNSFKGLLDKFSPADIGTIMRNVPLEYDNIIKVKTILDSKTVVNTTTVMSVINILIAFDELTKMILGGYGNIDNTNSINIKYVLDLQKTIKEHYDKIMLNADEPESEPPTVSNLSLIYDRIVKIPHYYNEEEHSTNNNENNTDYLYTADISYSNANLFYEKYWDLNDKDNTFLYNYDYFVSSYLFGGYRPNLFKILIVVVLFIIFIYILALICGFILMKLKTAAEFTALFGKIYTALYPLFLFVILIAYILLFIRFNTMFNSSVVYKCLDSSYKRSLNKLNNVVVPYIRMYDNKILKGNKNYLQHYIITNVFYSILSGNIKLCNLAGTTAGTKSIINEPLENENYYDIPRIKSARLKLTNMNNSILSNDNEFREYYKAKFENLYKDGYVKAHAESIYGVFRHLFRCVSGVSGDKILKSEKEIDAYFNEIINRDNVLKIYSIIKKCFTLFNEETFNNNLIYYNNHENKQKGVKIDAYNKFKFYKYGDKVIPYKFILKLNTFADYEEFVKDISGTVGADLDANISKHFGTYMNILVAANEDEDLESQAADLENNKDRNLVKLIGRYLLILGHINYNRIEYVATKDNASKKEIYEKKTTYLYKLFSNILYNDTYDIDDTFVVNSKGGSGSSSGGIVSIAITNAGTGYTKPPIIKIIPDSNSGGTDAVAEAVLKPTPIENIVINNGGFGYITPPKITIQRGGAKTDATAVANIDPRRGTLTSITITNAGTGYTKVPTIFIANDVSGGGGGSGAEAIATLKPTAVESITITNAGTGYTTIPRVEITNASGDSTGSGATAVALNSLLIGDGEYAKYKRLTYIYNYLETRYVNISANNNKNYLMNIIKGINNKINDDDKIMNTESKSAMYMFNDNINLMKTPKEYDNEDEVLNVANSVSTSTLASTYIFNIILIIVYFKVISANIT